MPCDSIQLCQVDLELANHDLLLKALRQLDPNAVEYNGNFSFAYKGQPYSIRNGKLICREGTEATADIVKQEYSRQALAEATRRMGWQLKNKNPQQQKKFAILKRY